MRLIIAGGREIILKPNQIDEALADFHEEIIQVISGGAIGVDKCGEIWAKENNIPIQRLLPMYKEFGKLAPKVRNRDMAAIADGLLAFWDGMSPGTAHMIATMVAQKKWLKVVIVEN